MRIGETVFKHLLWKPASDGGTETHQDSQCATPPRQSQAKPAPNEVFRLHEHRRQNPEEAKEHSQGA